MQHSSLPVARSSLPVISSMSELAIENVRAVEGLSSKMEQVPLVTEHVLHAGLYSRTVTIPAGGMVTGVFVTTPTLLIVNGDALIYRDIGLEPIHVLGYQVIPAGANRKQLFMAKEETTLTMIFATQAKTIEAAEDEFTNETHLLSSRLPNAMNKVTITGD